MKKTTTTATANLVTVTKYGKKAVKGDFTTYAPATPAPAPIVYEEKTPFSLCDGVLDYVYRNNVHKALATAYLKGLESKGNLTAGALLRGENAPFNREDLEGICLTALCGYVFENGVTVEKNGELPSEMVLSAFRAMSSGEVVDTIAGKRTVSGMYAQGVRVYKWLQVETTTDDGETMTSALNNIEGLASCIEDIETKTLYESLLPTLDKLERYYLKKRLEGYAPAEIVSLYGKSKKLCNETAEKRMRTARRTLKAKAIKAGLTI